MLSANLYVNGLYSYVDGGFELVPKGARPGGLDPDHRRGVARHRRHLEEHLPPGGNRPQHRQLAGGRVLLLRHRQPVPRAQVRGLLPELRGGQLPGLPRPRRGPPDLRGHRQLRPLPGDLDPRRRPGARDPAPRVSGHPGLHRGVAPGHAHLRHLDAQRGPALRPPIGEQRGVDHRRQRGLPEPAAGQAVRRQRSGLRVADALAAPGCDLRPRRRAQDPAPGERLSLRRAARQRRHPAGQPARLHGAPGLVRRRQRQQLLRSGRGLTPWLLPKASTPTTLGR